MRIGIDATALPDRPTGAGNYIVNLLRCLAARESEFSFRVFIQEGKEGLLDIRERADFQWVRCAPLSPARRLAWEQTQFPGLLRKHRLDLLHSLHYTMPLLKPVRQVVTLHDMTFFLYPQRHTQAKRRFFPWMIRQAGRRADALLAVSESTRRDAICLAGIPPEKIFTTNLGVSPAFHPIDEPAILQPVAEKYHLPQAFILYVGVIEPRKNIPLLLRAYARARQAGVKHRLVIAGKLGWNTEQVFQTVDQLRLQEQVLFTGYIPTEELPMVYNLADLFVYPSQYEGFGLPPLEALACGTPVITTNVSAMPDVVGEAGWLVPPGDEDALQQAMIELLEHPEQRAELARRGLQQATGFTWQHTAEATLSVYRRLASK